MQPSNLRNGLDLRYLCRTLVGWPLRPRMRGTSGPPPAVRSGAYAWSAQVTKVVTV